MLVHGITGPDFPGMSNGVDCGGNSEGGGYWGDAINYLSNQGYAEILTVQYYAGDTNCDVNLHTGAYQSYCDSWVPGNEGTNNEDLNHVSCLLANYLNLNFAGGKPVILVGHSMGGIIVRNAVSLVDNFGGQSGIPNDIGDVTDAVTFNSPHSGVNDIGNWACGGCTQVTQLTADDPFMIALGNTGQNPQTSAGFTQWTVVGSECDPYVGSSVNPDGAATAIAMQASHAIMYSNQDSTTCYSHTSALGDSSTANDAAFYYCDTNDPTGNACGINYEGGTNWQFTTGGPHGLQLLYDAVGQ